VAGGPLSLIPGLAIMGEVGGRRGERSERHVGRGGPGATAWLGPPCRSSLTLIRGSCSSLPCSRWAHSLVFMCGPSVCYHPAERGSGCSGSASSALPTTNRPANARPGGCRRRCARPVAQRSPVGYSLGSVGLQRQTECPNTERQPRRGEYLFPGAGSEGIHPPGFGESARTSTQRDAMHGRHTRPW
jgi:hypothetical protein